MFNPIQPLIDLAFPDLCTVCGREIRIPRNLFCMRCLSGLPYTGYENEPDNEFVAHFQPEIRLEHGVAIFHLHPGSGIARVIHQLKYHKRAFLGIRLGEFMGSVLSVSSLDCDFDAIVPVPLHKKKERKRGYNQSERIAAGLSRVLAIPLDEKLIRRDRFTVTQTSLNRLERLKNTRDAFSVNEDRLDRYEHVLLVDDVLTTGATLSGCALALTRKKELKLSMITVALGD